MTNFQSSSSSVGVSTGRNKVLVVDLDGTLLKSDLLWEGLRAYLVPAPWRIVTILVWLIKGGRPWLKARIAQGVAIDGAVLPWNPAVVAFCESQTAAGWTIVLATGSNQTAAMKATRAFPFITEVFGSDEQVNLTGRHKADRLIARFGRGGFDYIGDCSTDIPVWAAADHGWLAKVSPNHSGWGKKAGKPLSLITGTGAGLFRSLAKAMRPHQWLKNLLVFFPLLAAHRWSDSESWWKLGPVFLALCCMASASYLLNDLADLDADRRHPRKKTRPLASGELSVATSLVALAGLFAAGIGLAALAGLPALTAIVVYFLLSALYSLTLKTVPVLDAIFLSGLYTYRMILGGVAAEVVISPWLLAFSTTFFLGLAFLKRYVELGTVNGMSGGLKRRGYIKEDLVFVLVTGVAASFLSIVVLALYLDSTASNALYKAPHWLWGIALVVLFWMMRVWFLAGRKRMHDDPVWFAARDPVTLGLALLCVVIMAAAGPR